jgi:predicted Zn-dependent peptidase
LQQAHICLGARLFGYQDERKYPLLLLDMMLGGGMSSRLFQNIREKYGFAYSVYSFSDIMENTGVLGVYLGCAVNKVEKSIDVLHKELRNLYQKKISHSELQHSKSQLKGQIILGMESSSRRMHRIGETEIYNGSFLSLAEILGKIESISALNISELAGEFLSDDKLATIIILPK